mmetsp:Transcript_39812/g.126601  ORF Transcript_39812/g.126601 Transcript_39812/m.126601 type:complete len:334 (-) Transcript_39812:442-1443(-)
MRSWCCWRCGTRNRRGVCEALPVLRAVIVARSAVAAGLTAPLGALFGRLRSTGPACKGLPSPVHKCTSNCWLVGCVGSGSHRHHWSCRSRWACSRWRRRHRRSRNCRHCWCHCGSSQGCHRRQRSCRHHRSCRAGHCFHGPADGSYLECTLLCRPAIHDLVHKDEPPRLMGCRAQKHAKKEAGAILHRVDVCSLAVPHAPSIRIHGVAVKCHDASGPAGDHGPDVRMLHLRQALACEGIHCDAQAEDLRRQGPEVERQGLVVPGALACAVIARVAHGTAEALKASVPDNVSHPPLAVEANGASVQVNRVAALAKVPAQCDLQLGHAHRREHAR